MVVSYIINPFAGFAIAIRDEEDVRGISSPFELLFKSSIALALGSEPSVLTATLCDWIFASNIKTMIAENTIRFII